MLTTGKETKLKERYKQEKQEKPERNWNELVIAEFRENDNMYIGKYILVVIFLFLCG